MPREWTSAYSIEWTPILPFVRRRIALMDWIDEKTEPLRFIDRDEYLGVSILSPDLRATVSRSRLLVSSGSLGAPIEALAPFLEGVLQTLTPKDVVLARASSTWSQEAGSGDYNELRASVARAASHIGAWDDPRFRPVDAATLVDFESPDVTRQVEWGVVDSAELSSRLRDPTMGRLNTDLQGVVPQESLPAVSYFATVSAVRKVGGQVESVDELLEAMHTADRNSGDLVGMIFGRVSEGRGSGEFAEAR